MSAFAEYEQHDALGLADLVRSEGMGGLATEHAGASKA